MCPPFSRAGPPGEAQHRVRPHLFPGERWIQQEGGDHTFHSKRLPFAVSFGPT